MQRPNTRKCPIQPPVAVAPVFLCFGNMGSCHGRKSESAQSTPLWQKATLRQDSAHTSSLVPSWPSGGSLLMDASTRYATQRNETGSTVDCSLKSSEPAQSMFCPCGQRGSVYVEKPTVSELGGTSGKSKCLSRDTSVVAENEVRTHKALPQKHTHTKKNIPTRQETASMSTIPLCSSSRRMPSPPSPR
jgi:hypothetical protein